MSSEIHNEEKSRALASSKVGAFVELTKPRITLMVLIGAAAAAIVAVDGWPDAWRLAHTVVGLFLVSASGSAANQYLERYTDFLMRRTAFRPLPDGRLGATDVALFAAVALGVGIAWLAMLVSWPTAALAGLTWLLYVLIYTPLKVITWLNTYVGAVAGALPVLIAAIGVQGAVSSGVWIYFAVMFIWQFPHFMAIAWLYRDQYGKGGLQMLPVVDPQGKWTARHAVAFAAALIPVSLLPVWLQPSMPWGVALGVLAIGIVFLASAIGFWQKRDDRAARRLLRMSLIYLPCYMAALLSAVFFG